MGSDSGATQSSELESGAVVNGLYRLVRLLGVGGMGEVWEARHERTKGRVALKLLLPEMGRHEQVLHRFQREVEITSSLNHPNIVRVSDADKLPNGRPFLVMEFLEGNDLSNVSRTAHALGLAETIEIIEQAAMGLQAAHGQGIIHRDLKPANIFVVPLSGTGRVSVKILDFGISKALDGLSQLTQSRSVMGTPHYMAPEQATGGASTVDPRADQFSLAAIAYELLTGRMAFAGDGMVNVIFKVVKEKPPSFSDWGITTPPEVEAVVMRGLAKSPAERFGSVLEFSNELRRTAGQIGTEGRVHAAILPTGRRTLTLPTPDSGLTESPPTTLRSSTGQVGVVGTEGEGLVASGDAAIRAAKSRKRKTMALVLGCAGLAATIFVGVSLRRSLMTAGTVNRSDRVGADPFVSPKPEPKSGSALVPTVAPLVVTAPSPAVAAPATFRVSTREPPANVEHLTLPATSPGPGVVQRPTHLLAATSQPPRTSSNKKKANDRKPPATTKTLFESEGPKIMSRAVKPAAQKSGRHSVLLNDDL